MDHVRTYLYLLTYCARRYYWALAEMIAAAGLLAQRTGSAEYWEWYDRAWRYAIGSFIDSERGGWRGIAWSGVCGSPFGGGSGSVFKLDDLDGALTGARSTLRGTPLQPFIPAIYTANCCNKNMQPLIPMTK